MSINLIHTHSVSSTHSLYLDEYLIHTHSVSSTHTKMRPTFPFTHFSYEGRNQHGATQCKRLHGNPRLSKLVSEQLSCEERRQVGTVHGEDGFRSAIDWRRKGTRGRGGGGGQ